jgi:hypothetical protein
MSIGKMNCRTKLGMCGSLFFTRLYRVSAKVNMILPFNLQEIRKVYENVDLQKRAILAENNSLSGIYMWTNKINGKIYIGSAVDLRIRLRCYFSAGYLERQASKYKSLIYSSLLKNGYDNFRLEILKYCSPDECIKWEQFYMDLLKPEYNILQIAGSSLGYRHKEESRVKISAAMKGIRKGISLSEEHKANISASLKAENHPLF